MVAVMSATSARSSSSYDVTGCCGVCITGVPHRVIARTVPPSGSTTDAGETWGASRMA